MSTARLNCGYVPLVDSAPLIVAQELNFAADEGLSLNLLRQPSWAALRDLLALGHLDAAHMLAPMPIAMSLGLSGPMARIDALMVLSVNGTVIGVSNAMAEAMRKKGWPGGFASPQDTAGPMLSALDRPLRVGVPFPYSMHRLLFEYWIGHTGLMDLSNMHIITTPPPLMAEAVASDEIDVFCVGEPWGSVAVGNNVGELILPGAAIWAHAPEKVLAARHAWVEENPVVVGALMRAVARASAWLDTPKNRPLAIEILARSAHLDLPHAALDHALMGRFATQFGAAPVDVPGFLRFHDRAANFPWRSQAAWIGAEIARLAGINRDHAIAMAQRAMRPDCYREHLGPIGVDMPGASAKIEGALTHPMAVASTRGEMILGPDAFFDGETFDFAPSE
ncbi:CmpA/NrtA family ABC transporter substrate-binding protein [Tateyamaria sp. ANG-S1]|uniref:CmpA/NrtA family ABC transporter substrate-binding protein n=1 Tax=Tateyamaria sp. ANG-S1 TaxID=1577905 RepID=UPI00057C8BAE|nr:CmpA/NrtA family ABC transporter substrate-binding protein [Tateyamaria sp. ANG-S1]KIC47982.1 nitrate transporter [Tateyamaria sp. ANG-S1]